ncbi:MAG: GNAT family N-acetyltransferase [Campylobacterota bacterium]
MQIRELDLKELYTVYDVLSQLRADLSYKEFEDLIYDMRHMEYKMLGIMDKEELITYAGVAVQTNFYHKRHLYVFDLVTDERYQGQGYGKMMLEYLVDYAKMGMCENIVLSSGFAREDAHDFYEKNGFEKKSFVFLKALKIVKEKN